MADGDRDALGALYDLHANGLFRHALWLGGRQADAEDAVQAVFVRLAGMGADLLTIRQPRPYLHRMVHSAVADMLGRQAKRAEQPLTEAIATGGGNLPGDQLVRRDLLRALAALPVEQREAIALHLVHGFAFREVGRITSVSTFTAASRFRLALERLRRHLDGQ
jgi:RNA polymerase sigma-70 factor (ECF subfamily)